MPLWKVMVPPDFSAAPPFCKIDRLERMNGSIMRRRRRGEPRSPSISDSEYFSDNAAHSTVEQPAGDAHSEQYPSEVDSVGEESEVHTSSGSTLPPPPIAPFSGELKAPRESNSPNTFHERAWYEFDLSVVLALLSPIANWLTGCDYVKNILLILLLVFYLHQIIEVPWNLYLESRPRRVLHAVPKEHSSIADKYHRAALSELHTLEIFYLTLSVLSPFLGATLLRAVVASFAGASSVSWFSISLFVLATGMRPWKHAIQRLRERTSDLHTVVHYPPSDAQRIEALIDRVSQLEAELKSLRRESKSFNSEMYEHVEDAVEMMEIAARRQEKKAEVSKAFMEGRLTKLEQNVEALLERMEIRADRPALYRITAQIATFVSALIEHLSPVLPTWVLARYRGNVSRSPRSSPKMGRSRTPIKLETIPEVATFQPKCSAQRSRCFRIPGLGLALRIGDLATLPFRCILGYLLAGRIYTPHSHAPSP